MDSAAVNSAATRNGGVSIPQATPFSSSSQSSRKEWGVLSEQSVGNEELDRSKLDDERLIYEQRLVAVAKRREELQQMEVELRAQLIVRSEILDMQNTYEAQIKEFATADAKLQEQLHEKEQKIHELERRMEEKERELHAIRLDYEAQAWAKDDLIREQTKELQSYRMERSSSEAERMQHIKQINDLQEHIEDQKRQFMELEEQQRIAQETIHFKDEQISEAQSWIGRAQEMDALQSTANHTLQTELLERTELYNQLWFRFQSQLADMERIHSYVQQLQLELAEAKEKNGVRSDVSKTISKDISPVESDNGSQLDVNAKTSPSAGSESTQNGNSESIPANSSGVNTALTQPDNVNGVAFATPSLLGMAAYLPPGQMAAFHPFMMHQQGVPHPSHVTQSHFHSFPPMSSFQHWTNPQVLLDTEQAPTDELHHQQQSEQNILKAESHDGYEASLNVQVPNMTTEVLDNSQAQPQNLQEISSQLHDALRLDSLKHADKTQEKKINAVAEDGLTNKNTVSEAEHSSFDADAFLSKTIAAISVISSETATDASFNDSSADTLVSSGQKDNVEDVTLDTRLLDERALLACIARTIGSRGRIKISSTLPNRLGKMLAPLHWHDYRKKYGKLEDFVASHPDLFVVEGDYIQLREGAQQIIAATAAVAKVAAVAAAEPSSFRSSLAMTPMAQPHRLRKVPSLGSSSVTSDRSSASELSVHKPLETINNSSQISSAQNHSKNDGFFHSSGGASGLQNGYEAKTEKALNIVSGTISETNRGKQQKRTAGAASSSGVRR